VINTIKTFKARLQMILSRINKISVNLKASMVNNQAWCRKIRITA
jgi:hypothetical protein